MGGPRAVHQAASVLKDLHGAAPFTADRFQPFGRPVAGVPMLLDTDMRLVEPACAWLLHIALVRGRTRSIQTWRTYAEVLYDWWQTLEANSWAWDRAGLHEVAAYRDGMLSRKSQHTGRAYARSTINGRLRILAQFYRWCSVSGLIAAVPHTFLRPAWTSAVDQATALNFW